MEKPKQTSKIQQGLVFTLLALMWGLTACSSNTNFSATRANAVSSDSSTASTQDISKCAAKLTDSGVIYDESLDGREALSAASFQQRVEDLVSVLFDPKDNLGDVTSSKEAAQAGVSFKGSLKFGSDNKLTEASLMLTIADSLTGQDDGSGGKIEAIQMNFYKAESGSRDPLKKTFVAVFADDYGSITLEGTYDATQAKGTIKFANKKIFDNSTPKEGPLGAFAISRCALIL